LKKLLLTVIWIFTICLFIGGCTKPGLDDFSRAHKMLSEMESYTVTAEITLKGDALVGNYIVKQYFRYPDRYRLEALDQDGKVDKITLYDGNKITIYQPLIDQTYIMENFTEVEETGMFPGYFSRNLFTVEEVQYGEAEVDGIECISIKVPIPGNNTYRKSQILYLDKKEMIPIKMEVLNSKGEASVTVRYKEFIYNPLLSDEHFTNVRLQEEENRATM